MLVIVRWALFIYRGVIYSLLVSFLCWFCWVWFFGKVRSRACRRHRAKCRVYCLAVLFSFAVGAHTIHAPQVTCADKRPLRLLPLKTPVVVAWPVCENGLHVWLTHSLLYVGTSRACLSYLSSASSVSRRCCTKDRCVHMPPDVSFSCFSYSCSLCLPSLFDIFSPCLGYPGEGPFNILSINVTSCPKHWQDLVDIQTFLNLADPIAAVCLQESRIPPSKVKSLQTTFSDHGWCLHVGYQPPVVPIRTQTKAIRQQHGGIAILTPKDVSVRTVEFSSEWLSLLPFCQVMWYPHGSGSSGFYIFNLYLPAHDSARGLRREIMEKAFQFAATLSGPVCMCGDFQDPPECNAAVAEAIFKGGWTDALFEVAAMFGKTPDFTYSARKDGWRDRNPKGKTRIDLWLLSPSFLPLLKNGGVHYNAPFPGHAVVSLNVDAGMFQAQAFTLSPHKKWDLPPIPKDQEQWDERDSQCIPILMSCMASLTQAIEDLDVERVWSIACQIATDMLNHVTQQNVPPTRGSTPKFKLKKPFVSHVNPHAPAARTSKAKRVIQEALVQSSRHRDGLAIDLVTFQNTIGNLRRLIISLGCPDIAFPPAVGTVEMEDWLNSLSSFCSDFNSKISRKVDAERLRKWKERMKVSSAADRKLVHSWIKDQQSCTPKCFRRSDGSITACPQEMLDMVTSRMEEIYNTHKGRDVRGMIEHFLLKYAPSIEARRCAVECPKFDHRDVFKLFQKRPSCKAAGLDGWLTIELKHLPPSGWWAFTAVMKLAEATGQWPRVIKLVSVATISKGQGTYDPTLTRAIGISSAVYSVWSSLRFRQLTPWHLKIAPASLYGGLKNRKALDSELDFSTDMHEHEDTMCAVFVDRYKCFDLIIPEVALKIALELGLPPSIYNAALGFYANQIKFFKIGQFYGRKVMSTNAAVQGCSLSILMVNSMYSVLAQHLADVSPDSRFTSFIDDCKIWTVQTDTDQLKLAFEALSSFDDAIGQQINETKSTVLSKFQKKAARFLRDVGRQFPSKKTVKSLGCSHTVGKKRCAKFQDQRVHKAIRTASRVSHLPLPEKQKILHTHSNVHSQWLYGCELQAPSKRMFQRLRTAVVGIFHKRSNCMRCPFHFLATFGDIYVDPWAAWVLHNLNWVRSEYWRDRDRLRSDLVRVRSLMRDRPPNLPFPLTSGGRVNNLCHIFHQLGWRVASHDEFVVIRQNDVDLNLVMGSRHEFQQELARSIRAWLLRQAPDRQDFRPKGHTSHVDIYRTRYLLDSSFADRNDMKILESIFAELPQPFERTRAILRSLLSGSVFTGRRLRAAGKTESDKCKACGRPEDHDHLFRSCPRIVASKPSGPAFDTLPHDTWCSGIMFESPQIGNWRRRKASQQIDLADDAQLNIEADFAFVDGSCFFSKWAPISSAASAVVFPNGTTVVREVPGLYASSQRAEIWALAIAIHHSVGPIKVGSDCQGVVNTFLWLDANAWNYDLLSKVDNADLWSVVSAQMARRTGLVTVFKVKAHVSTDYKHQPALWTDLNAKADAAAKQAARAKYEAACKQFEPELVDGVVLHVHLVKVLFDRFQQFAAEISNDAPMQRTSPGSSQRRRIWGKQSVSCPTSSKPSFHEDSLKSFVKLSKACRLTEVFGTKS